MQLLYNSDPVNVWNSLQAIHRISLLTSVIRSSGRATIHIPLSVVRKSCSGKSIISSLTPLFSPSLANFTSSWYCYIYPESRVRCDTQFRHIDLVLTCCAVTSFCWTAPGVNITFLRLSRENDVGDNH